MHLKSKPGTRLELDSGKSDNFLTIFFLGGGGGKKGVSFSLFVLFLYLFCNFNLLKGGITELFEFYGLCFAFRNILLPKNSEIAICISMKKKKMTDPCMLKLYKYNI